MLEVEKYNFERANPHTFCNLGTAIRLLVTLTAFARTSAPLSYPPVQLVDEETDGDVMYETTEMISDKPWTNSDLRSHAHSI